MEFTQQSWVPDSIKGLFHIKKDTHAVMWRISHPRHNGTAEQWIEIFEIQTCGQYYFLIIKNNHCRMLELRNLSIVYGSPSTKQS